ncbi:MAG: hypothetical protein ACI92B_001258 [Marinobacter maritimus]|jgi:hypothetical protein|uniref:hypothetical protein n=1 Tax=Marinobacter maritimus TaxID=277961 RepID=UPI000BDB0F57|nr:hypothetical protein [Marinobacter maritimus]MBL1274374.1 hypothetical protein [Oceanospirillales bacterium]|tara:strand:- start:320 stop:832 length:513 start_codon:yes stop_codon:yes gene_type:complete
MLPDSATIQSSLRKAVAAITGIVLALVLLTALLITGFYLLVNAAALALAPLVGEPGAMAITGLACLCLLALFFYRLTRPARALRETEGNSSGSGTSSPIDVLRSLIASHPLEAAALAFAVGVAEQGDPRLKNLLLQGGMVLMRQSAGSGSTVTGDSEGAPAPSADNTSSE